MEQIVRQRTRPLDEGTNGHAPGSQHIDSSDYPSSSEEENDNGTTSRQRQLVDRARLRFSTPYQLIDEHQAATDAHLLCYLLLFRCIVGIVTSRSVFAPDEQWQSLEIAHRIVFGYGYETWEWRDRRNVSSNRSWGMGPIRSPLYPALFVPAYWLLEKLSLDHTMLLTFSPSMIQAALAAVTDFYTYRLARKLLNDRAAWITLIPSLLSVYTFHTSTRTLSNSAEAFFTILALYYWPLSLPQDSDRDLVGEMPLVDAGQLQKSVVLFAFSAILRPSNILLSLPLVLLLAIKIIRNVKSAATALESAFALIVVGRICLAIGILAGAFLTMVDSLYYRRLTFTPIAFFKRNVLDGLSLFYGQSPLHFYLSSALPFVCFTTLPYTLHGIVAALRSIRLGGFDSHVRRWYGIRGECDPVGLKVLAQAVLIFMATMSLLGHKEVRFLQPIVPALHIFEGYALTMLPSIQTIWHSGTKGLRAYTQAEGRREAAEVERRAERDRASQLDVLEALSAHLSSRSRRQILPPTPRLLSRHILSRFRKSIDDVLHRHGRLCSTICFGAHILPILYLCFHSQGQMAVTIEVGRLSQQGALDQVAFLMPCHSTPWMSHMHDKRLSQGENAVFITCEPPLEGQSLADYKDESDYFYDDPYTFLLQRYSSSAGSKERLPWPSHVVLFEALLAEGKSNGNLTIASMLEQQHYKVQRSYWNSLFHLDRRRRGRVLLMTRKTGQHTT